MEEYFNFRRYGAEDWWARRAFLARWWRVNARDRRWTPQNHAALYDALVRRSVPAVERFSPAPMTLEAMVRRSNAGVYSSAILPGPADEQCVGIVAPLLDARGTEPVVWLAMFSAANNSEVAERLLGLVYEAYPGASIVGPASLAPRMAGGVLLDHFHVDPPVNSPYNPPYLAEILEGVLEPVSYDRMWRLDLEPQPLGRPVQAGLETRRESPGLLAEALHPLLEAAWDPLAGQAPDAAEVAFALRLWQGPTLLCWCAAVDGEAVGYVLAQADAGRAMRRTQGGRTLQGRVWHKLQPADRAAGGRVLIGGVAPRWRRQGVGRALLGAVAAHARSSGWSALSIGPLPQGGEGEAFLEACGARPRQRYGRFASEADLWNGG